MNENIGDLEVTATGTAIRLPMDWPPNRPRPVQIDGSPLKGYIVTVGCKTIVFTSLKELMIELRRYLTSPREVTIEYLKSEDKAKNG